MSKILTRDEFNAFAEPVAAGYFTPRSSEFRHITLHKFEGLADTVLTGHGEVLLKNLVEAIKTFNTSGSRLGWLGSKQDKELINAAYIVKSLYIDIGMDYNNGIDNPMEYWVLQACIKPLSTPQGVLFAQLNDAGLLQHTMDTKAHVGTAQTMSGTPNPSELLLHINNLLSHAHMEL